eukprot:763340-Hanusia_phi.AAC.15
MTCQEQHVFKFHMVEPQFGNVISSPEILSFVLLPHCDPNNRCEVGITIIPPRIFHGSRQKIPYSCAFLMDVQQLSEMDNRAKSCEDRKQMGRTGCMMHLTRRASLLILSRPIVRISSDYFDDYSRSYFAITRKKAI